MDTYNRTIPSDEEWDADAIFNGLLEKFSKATKKFSRSKFPTVHLFLLEVCSIQNDLLEILCEFHLFFFKNG